MLTLRKEMTERYDTTVARHYAAFRPPLHRPILDRVIRPHESFRVGLDAGCGTGHSAVALAKYCERVFGLDPSQSMLDVAQGHPKITYLQGSGDELGQLPVQPIDIVTFAGSLFYAKSDRLRKELLKVCPPGGTIVVYDFQAHLDERVAGLETDCPAAASKYDHRANLSDWIEFATDGSGSDRLRLDITERQMAHLLLADSDRCAAFAKRFPGGDPFEPLVRHLRRSRRQLQLEASIYFTRYRVLGQ